MIFIGILTWQTITLLMDWNHIFQSIIQQSFMTTNAAKYVIPMNSLCLMEYMFAAKGVVL